MKNNRNKKQRQNNCKKIDVEEKKLNKTDKNLFCCCCEFNRI